MPPQLFAIPHGDAGTLATVEHMRRMAYEAALAPAIRRVAARVVLGSPERFHPVLLRDWIALHVQYLADPTYAEALHAPEAVLRAILTRGLAQIDCDDVAMLAAAMGLSIGLRARFVVVAFYSPDAPYRHVWTDLADPSGSAWVAVDPTRPLQGLDAAGVSRRLVVTL